MCYAPACISLFTPLMWFQDQTLEDLEQVRVSSSVQICVCLLAGWFCAVLSASLFYKMVATLIQLHLEVCESVKSSCREYLLCMPAHGAVIDF